MQWAYDGIVMHFANEQKEYSLNIKKLGMNTSQLVGKLISVQRHYNHSECTTYGSIIKALPTHQNK